MLALDVPRGAERLLVVLHGYGDDVTLLPAAVQANRPLRLWDVAAPTGPTRCAVGRAWFPSAPEDDGPPLVDVLDALAEAVSQACANHALDSRRVAVLGWSQGAATALALALRSANGRQPEWRPHMVVGLAAWLVNEPGVTFDLGAAARRGTAVGLVHGSLDDVVPVAQGRSTFRALERHGLDVNWIERHAGHDLPPLLDAAGEWLQSRS